MCHLLHLLWKNDAWSLNHRHFGWVWGVVVVVVGEVLSVLKEGLCVPLQWRSLVVLSLLTDEVLWTENGSLLRKGLIVVFVRTKFHWRKGDLIMLLLFLQAGTSLCSFSFCRQGPHYAPLSAGRDLIMLLLFLQAGTSLCSFFCRQSSARARMERVTLLHSLCSDGWRTISRKLNLSGVSLCLVFGQVRFLQQKEGSHSTLSLPQVIFLP